MKKLTIATSIALLFCTGLYARLGETLEELKERYGEPVAHREDELDYKLHDMEISAIIRKRDGKRVAAGITYQREKDQYGAPKVITKNEVKILLNANFGQDNWTKHNSDKITSTSFTQNTYVSKEGLAVHETVKHVVTFVDMKLAAKLHDDNSKKMDDF